MPLLERILKQQATSEKTQLELMKQQQEILRCRMLTPTQILTGQILILRKMKCPLSGYQMVN